MEGSFKFWLYSILVSFLILKAHFGYCQNYPVHISSHLTPPYSGYLPDYADPGSEKLKLILQLNDFSVAQYNIKLKFEIKGSGFTLSTKTFFNPPPIILQPGQPLLLSGTDLAQYLNSNNLDFTGINQLQYEQKKVLPEGYYSICVTAYDYYNNSLIQVSNEACAQAWFTLSDPPFLNLPLCNSVINPLTPQNIIFQWTPMNLGSPNSALNTEYDFFLWECRPDSNANPNQVVLSTAPIYSTTTRQTFINYGITEPSLNMYMKYIWKVRAKDISGRDLFKNNGYSQIYTFKYGSIQNVMGNSLALTLTSEAINHRTGRCTWNSESVFTGYSLQVRKQGTTEWFNYPSTLSTLKIDNLEPETTYEARVQGSGNGITGEWSNTSSFTTPAAPVYACNNQIMPYNTALPQPLDPIKAVNGLIIQSGQFEVKVSQIFSTGYNGWYAGKGYVSLMGLKKVPVKWSNIYIDSEARHQQGVIQAQTSGINNWLHQWDLNNAQDNASYINGTFDTVFINNGQICYVLQGNSNTICVPTPTGVNVVVIRDGDGNEYDVSLNPPPAKITGPVNYLHYSSDSLAASENKMAIFEASANQAYGFDHKEYAGFINNYEAIKLRNGNNYFVPNKSVASGHTDQVIASLTIAGFNSSLLKFKTAGGDELNFTSLPRDRFLIGEISHSIEAVYAWYNNEKIGKLNIVSLEEVSKKVVLVPVNNTPIPGGIAGISSSLNTTYRQANVTWSVSAAQSFTFGLGDGALDAADVTLLSKYSSEMRALRDAYKQHDSLYDKNAYYLFVVPAFSDQNIKGYMVRGRAVGFISSNATTKEIAHELGHGAFGFEHTFPKIEKSTSNNLMDYSTGISMVKSQWVDVHLPSTQLNWRDEEEDASYCANQAADNVIIFETLKQIKSAYNKNLSMPISQLSDGRVSGYRTEKVNVAGISYDYIYLYKDLGSNTTKTTISPKNNITSEEKLAYYASGPPQPYGLIKIDNSVYIEVPADRRVNMELYLKSPQGKNLLLFVNGYRQNTPSLTEKPNSTNKIYNGDVNGYWCGIDADFMNRINTKNAVYADGHHSVSTANHLSQAFFLASMKSSMDPTALTFLNVTPNVAGYQVRYNYGRVAGYDFVNKLNTNSLEFDKNSDTLDIVAHSMGYAYAIGIVDVLKTQGIRFGRFYILAPENACTGGTDWTRFTEVWQYGSNLGQPNADPIKLQDGVAPQCECANLVNSNGQINPGNNKPIKTGRVYIPVSVTTKSFVGSHSINNYGWIFNITQGDPKGGYVKPRN